MLITNITGMTPLHQTAAYPREEQLPETAETAGSRDRVELSPSSDSAETRFSRALSARISREVRVAHTGADRLAQIKESVADGSYRWNLDEIGARMLLRGGEC